MFLWTHAFTILAVCHSAQGDPSEIAFCVIIIENIDIISFDLFLDYDPLIKNIHY